MDESDLDALVELDAFEEVRSAIDPFSEHIPDDPSERREYERRFLRPAGYLAAIELATGRFLGWFQLQDEQGRAVGAEADGDRGAEAVASDGAEAVASDGAEAVASGGDRGAEAAAPAGARAAPARTEVEIGYRFQPDAWGRGFASEGAAVLLEYALSRPEVERVYAHALESNPRSIKVMQKIGMTFAAPWSYRGLPGAEYEAWPGTGPLSAPAKRP
jgi:RimJ/RimL family protein N-acetyltransferase